MTTCLPNEGHFAPTLQLIRHGVPLLGEIGHASWRFGGEPNVGESPYGNLFKTHCHGAIAVEFTNHAVGSLLGTCDSSYAYPDAQYIEINGTKGGP